VAGLVNRREAAGKRLVEQLLQYGPDVFGQRLPRAHVYRGFVDLARVRHVGRLEDEEAEEESISEGQKHRHGEKGERAIDWRVRTIARDEKMETVNTKLARISKDA